MILVCRGRQRQTETDTRARGLSTAWTPGASTRNRQGGHRDAKQAGKLNPTPCLSTRVSPNIARWGGGRLEIDWAAPCLLVGWVDLRSPPLEEGSPGQATVYRQNESHQTERCLYSWGVGVWMGEGQTDRARARAHAHTESARMTSTGGWCECW